MKSTQALIPSRPTGDQCSTLISGDVYNLMGDDWPLSITISVTFAPVVKPRGASNALSVPSFMASPPKLCVFDPVRRRHRLITIEQFLQRDEKTKY
jgi:hypothetical protein